MRDLRGLTADKILKISTPELLFSSSEKVANAEYRVLARRWHPDLDKQLISSRVFAHVAQLYRLALQKILDGSWDEPCEKAENECPGTKKFRKAGGEIRQIEYQAMREFELGSMFIGQNQVVFEVDDEFADLASNARQLINSFPFQNQAMAAEVSTYLPQIKERFKTRTSTVFVVRKTPDQILLSDLLVLERGTNTSLEHLGWIMNVLLNIACYLEWAGLTHNAISTKCLFISPLRHTGMLLGGWWYSVPFGRPLMAAPDELLSVVAERDFNISRASTANDLALIKAVLTELLDSSAFDSSNARARLLLSKFLHTHTKSTAAENYAFWKYEILPEAFGPPKFIKWKLESHDIYHGIYPEI